MRRGLWLLLGLFVVLALAGCAREISGVVQFAADAPDAPQTTVFPLSDTGRRVQTLYELIFWMALVVFVGVEGALLYILVRFRRPAGGVASQTHGNTRLEIAWTVIPAVILLIIAVPTIETIFSEDAPSASASENQIRVEVTGHQWWWEFRYPELGADVVTANEFHLPVGRTAFITMTSADVIHSFWIPKMTGKMDAIPTRVNHIWFTAQQTGEYYGQCVQFCGTEHADMRLRLFVDTPQDFDAWVRRQSQGAQAPVTSTVGLAAVGARVFQSGACPGCHTIRGTPAQGKVGPDLTHVGSRTTIASGVLTNNLENLTRWVTDAQAVKPEAKMPTLGCEANTGTGPPTTCITRSDVDAVVAYLRTLQ
ncbi:MAG TPA: cytochrome c oxidase subunit II [Chloroflexota bacterium]|jgi:cytochrome c oxidase subunit 2